MRGALVGQRRLGARNIFVSAFLASDATCCHNSVDVKQHVVSLRRLGDDHICAALEGLVSDVISQLRCNYDDGKEIEVEELSALASCGQTILTNREREREREIVSMN